MDKNCIYTEINVNLVIAQKFAYTADNILYATELRIVYKPVPAFLPGNTKAGPI